MEFKELLKRALEIRQKFAEFEKRKVGKEWTNSQIMEGLVVDVGDLMKLVMAKEGAREVENVNEKLVHELCDCLWAIMVLSDKYGIDLEKVFMVEMEKLDKKLNNEINESKI